MRVSLVLQHQTLPGKRQKRLELIIGEHNTQFGRIEGPPCYPALNLCGFHTTSVREDRLVEDCAQVQLLELKEPDGYVVETFVKIAVQEGL